jgi:flagellin
MISINTNPAATSASYNLNNTNNNLQKSINRLSSGNRITSSSDDAGGLAVSMKLSAAIRRTDATESNVGNAVSFLQTQDGAMKNVDSILARMSELATLAQDVTKTTTDLALYDTEFQDLLAGIDDITNETFNSIDLFDGASLTVRTSEDGIQTVDITQADLSTDVHDVITGDLTSNANAVTAAGEVTTAIQNLADLRATNGSEQSRLGFAIDMLATNGANLEAANSRIMDVDVATESTEFARLSILQQAGTAMLAQANQSQEALLGLLK